MNRMVLAGRVLFADGVLREGEVVVENARIVQVQERSRVPDQIIAPGLIDLQVNGAFGYDFTADPETIRLVAQKLSQTGVTAFLPTIITSPLDTFQKAYAAIENLADDGTPEPHSARTLGLHFEGPYLSPKRAGAHNPAFLRPRADPQRDGLLLPTSPTPNRHLKIMTLAPELENGLEAIRELRAQNIVASVGHSAATFEQARAAFDAGATWGTHLFNAMTPLQHREPGVVGALLADTRATVGVIPDGVHVHPSILTWLVKAKGIERITLVTDQMAAAGLEAGEYRLGDRRVLVDESSARLEDGTLAGSILTLDQGIRNLVAWRACSPAEALTMASTTPARLLGLDHLGRIEGGCTADLVVLDPDLNVRQTIIDGQVVFE